MSQKNKALFDQYWLVSGTDFSMISQSK